MYRFDTQALSQCKLENVTLGKKEKVSMDSVLYKVTYLEKGLRVITVLSDLSVTINSGLAIFTFAVDKKVEFFFDQLDTLLKASIPSVTDGRLCATCNQPEIWKAYTSSPKHQKWTAEICVESMYETAGGRTLINHLEKFN